MNQGIFNFPDQVQGTTLKAWNYQILVNNAAPATSLVSASMVFEKNGSTTLDVPLTVTDATLWKIFAAQVNASDMDIEVGIHTFDLKTTDSAGTVEKYIRGEMEILPSAQQ